MKEQFIGNYVKKITKEDIVLFAKKNNIELDEKEVDILYEQLQKNWKVFLYENPTPIFKELKTKLNSDTYEKGVELFFSMKQKYQSFL
ncbi:MAG: DUF2624 family protein [Bacilli bacterium]|nr:DUF2624 family protein [Bacilli bacterium]